MKAKGILEINLLVFKINLNKYNLKFDIKSSIFYYHTII